MIGSNELKRRETHLGLMAKLICILGLAAILLLRTRKKITSVNQSHDVSGAMV